MNLSELAVRAARAAARLRASHRIGPADALCPYDLAEHLGIVVRFTALPSLEGVYAPEPKPTIFVNVERPVGRRRYTCGHEVGHHLFGHGTRLDELTEDLPDKWSPEEFLAQRFSAALLMPKLAVESAFARRGWQVGTAGPEAVFIVAQELGVGYTTLVAHLERTLRNISASQADTLRRVPLPRLRCRLARFQVEQDLVVVDEHWGTRPIDVEMGDIIMLPASAAFEGTCATFSTQPAPHLVALAPGIGHITLGSNQAKVRVSRRAFIGLARYRHLEEATDDQ